MRAFDIASQTPWAITEPGLRLILEIANREGEGPQAVAAKLGRPLDNSRAASNRDGVAIIPISGPIFRHANLFTEISGATSIEALGLDLGRALADPQIHAILLDIDSPGGEVNGTNEFANMVARAEKPVRAYISHMGASAAYWIASAAEQVIVDDAALVGSIGVVAVVPDQGAEKVKDIEIVSSQSPRKRVDPSTEKGRAEIQSTVDATADVFLAAVARNRGVTVETVLEEFGQGGLFVGQAAVTAGLADRVGSYEQCVADLVELRTQRRSIATSHPPVRGSIAQSIVAAHRQEASMPMDWKAVFGGLFGAAKEIEDGETTSTQFEGRLEQTEGTPLVGEQLPGSTLLPARSTPQAGPSDEVAELRRQIAAERGKRIQTEAQSFADGLLAQDRATVAETDHLVALYRRAAEDDHSNPITAADGQEQPSRVAMLRASMDNRPALGLLGERLPGTAQLGALPTPSVTRASGAHVPLDAERKQKLMEATPLGQRTLGERKN